LNIYKTLQQKCKVVAMNESITGNFKLLRCEEVLVNEINRIHAEKIALKGFEVNDI
jgi:hypothetical protein